MRERRTSDVGHWPWTTSLSRLKHGGFLGWPRLQNRRKKTRINGWKTPSCERKGRQLPVVTVVASHGEVSVLGSHYLQSCAMKHFTRSIFNRELLPDYITSMAHATDIYLNILIITIWAMEEVVYTVQHIGKTVVYGALYKNVYIIT